MHQGYGAVGPFRGKLVFMNLAEQICLYYPEKCHLMPEPTQKPAAFGLAFAS